MSVKVKLTQNLKAITLHLQAHAYSYIRKSSKLNLTLLRSLNKMNEGKKWEKVHKKKRNSEKCK